MGREGSRQAANILLEVSHPLLLSEEAHVDALLCSQLLEVAFVMIAITIFLRILHNKL